MKKKSIYLYSISILFCLLIGSHAWFIWPLEDSKHKYMLYAMFVIGGYSFIYYKASSLHLRMDGNTLTGLFFFFIAYVLGARFSLYSFAYIVPFLLFIWILLSDAKDYSSIKGIMIRGLSIIMVPGILLHLYSIANGFIPGFPISHPNNSNYFFINSIFCLKSLTYYESDGLRFQSIFLEPAFLGTLMAYILYSIRFDFKKYKSAWILLVGLILSLSLAGYLLTILGLFFNAWSKDKSVKKIAQSILLILVLYGMSLTYNDGHNFINEKVIERLDRDNEHGIKGNNRVGDATNFYFDKLFINESFLLGLGGDEIARINGGKDWMDTLDMSSQIRGAGYKIFILYKGIIAALFYLFAYYFLGVRGNGNKKYALGYYIIIIATFIQAAYPESFSWLIPFILGTNDKSHKYCKL